jgi:hypothetical protein
MKFKDRIKRIFNPPPGTPRWLILLPYGVLVVLLVLILTGGTYAWDYTNSPQFCGTTCHTMPPQNATYVISPHANVYCTECHVGRAFVGEQLARKTEDVYELYSMVFNLYEFPIRATRTKPDILTCEKCHLPETFSDDSLRTITRFKDDIPNTSFDIYLILKTGGGTEREGLGKGIHWHIVNPVYYYSDDLENQEIPYVRVTNDDGSYTEYVDVESGFDPASLDESQLKAIECTTCHNRVSHNFQPPSVSVDSAMARGLISPEIPGIHRRAVEALSTDYPTRGEAMAAIDAIEEYYKNSDYYPGHGEQISAAVETLKDIYDRTVFLDQKVDWTTHPNNIGHTTAPGCFRCHDGKHLDDEQQAIRLECNLCHSIPVVADDQDFVANIEINRGPEPESHLNPNWISLHNQAFDATCANCHTTDDLGGTSDTSFCSNSACHGNAYTFAGFDAPALREILKDQLPPQPEAPTPAPVVGDPTFDANLSPLFAARCTACHGETASAGLDLSSYEGALKGSDDGPVIQAGDSEGSLLVQVQRGTHFATFSTEELELLIQWIDAGAPEQ